MHACTHICMRVWCNGSAVARGCARAHGCCMKLRVEHRATGDSLPSFWAKTQAGDFVTFPDEFACYWHVIEEINKHYYLY